MERMEKQTIEEAAEKLYQKGLQNDLDLSFHDGVKFGAKWQAERMYSEEDFKLFARQFYREIKLDKSNLLWDELADKCFEQFKKK